MKREPIVITLVALITFSMFTFVFPALITVKGTTRINQKQVTLTLTLPEIVKVREYDWLTIPECSYISMPGHPMLPIKSVVMKLPLNSDITETAARVEEVSLTDSYFIMPALNPVQVDSAESSNTTEPDPTVYGSNELYPSEWYVFRTGKGLDPDTNTRIQYATFYFYPLRYLPAQKRILFAQNVSFTVSYTESVEPTIQTGIRNLIITSDLLEPYARQLATYKNSTGMPSKVLNTTWTYKNYGGIDRPEQIRNCIKDFAATYGITYVTIFGDADQVPVRSVFVNDTGAGEPYVPTDLYYGDLDGTWDDNNDGIYGDRRYDNVDGIPDVYVGRIPPSLASYAQTAVDKIKGYEQQFNASASWTRRIVLGAGTGHNGVSNTLGNATTVLKEYIANIVKGEDVVKLYESYGNLSTGSMASEINKGALFVNFAGHGDPGVGFGSVGWLFYWVVPGLWWNGFGTVDVQGLTNGFKLPVVTTMSCSTARFDDVDCIGEWFVLEPHGGSIAYFGSTRIAYTYTGSSSPYGLMGEMDWRIYQTFCDGYLKLGQMWGIPVTKYVQSHIWNYKYASVYDVKTLMEFVLLGDPTLRIFNSGREHDIAVRNVSPSKTSVFQGDFVNVNVTLENQGTSGDSFNVTAYATSVDGGDNFNDNLADFGMWKKIEKNNGTVTETNGRLECLVKTAPPSGSAGYITRRSYDVSDCDIQVDVSNQHLCEATLAITLDGIDDDFWYSSNFYSIEKHRWDTTCNVKKRVQGGDRIYLYDEAWTGPAGVLRIKISNGTIYFFEGGNLRYSEKFALSSYNCYIHLEANTWGDGCFGMDYFDNFKFINNKPIGRQEVYVPSGNFTTLTYAWDTTDYFKGKYTLSAYAWPVPGETDTEDNSYFDGTVQIVSPKISTAVSFTLSPNPAYPGQTVTLEGNLRDQYGNPLRSMGLNVYLNGNVVGRLLTNRTGGFYAAGVPMSPGTYSITVSFSGTGTFRSSSQMQKLIVLPKIDTKISFTLSPNPAKNGQTITLLGNLTEQNGNPISNAPVDILYSIDNGVTWIYAGTLQTNSVGRFTAQGKLTIVGTFLVKVSYKGNFKYSQSYRTETLTINPST
jgi:hypothetical protein